MPTVTLSQFRGRQFGESPYGNLSTLAFALITNALGAAIDSDQATGLAVGDVVVLGSLPEGMRLEDADTFVSTAMTAAVTGSLGFRYEDGVDDATVPQDAAYFGTGIALNAAGRYRANAAKALVTLPKPALLILTTAGAANAKASKVEVVVKGELTGSR